MKLKFMCCPKDSCARCTVAGSGAYLDSRLACGAVLGLGSYIDRKGTQVSCACVQHYPRIQSSWIRASALVNILICRNALKLPRVWTGSIVNKLGRIPSLVFPPCAAPRARCEASRVGPEELSGKSVRVVCVCARARAPTRARPVPRIFLHQSLSALTHGSRCTWCSRICAQRLTHGSRTTLALHCGWSGDSRDRSTLALHAAHCMRLVLANHRSASTTCDSTP